MKQYKIFRNASGQVEAVKQGWSWPAFFFSVIWAIAKRLWIIAIWAILIVMAIGTFLSLNVDYEYSYQITNIISLLVYVVFGVYGNRWREKHLLTRGFKHVETLTAANPAGAVALYSKATSEAA
ncbi:DUF2628 domain-containing protein [Plesiomonas shigelloides]|uniref:DUF2628 domain-containing protein n=1 Tax=Plesiomonas shigelloides TaxID=703 RepID=A0A8I1W8Z3_PLESH|nr:DUF2628 domain-containing protein [Plesiomonas shigelloides]MBO1109425.1 DUF2628 domain-containing protein [Plesiomonas shigelloides]